MTKEEQLKELEKFLRGKGAWDAFMDAFMAEESDTLEEYWDSSRSTIVEISGSIRFVDADQNFDWLALHAEFYYMMKKHNDSI